MVLKVSNPLNNIDDPVKAEVPGSPDGMFLRSHSTVSVIPKQPHLFAGDHQLNQGCELMISISTAPTSEQFNLDYAESGYEFTTHYFNKTNRPIRITDRNNLTITINKSAHYSHHAQEYFVVRKAYKFLNAAIAKSVLTNHHNSKAVICTENKERDMIIKIIDDKIAQGGFNGKPNNHTYIQVDRIIPINLFKTYLAIYVKDLDLLIRQGDYDEGLAHPYSDDAVVKGEALRGIGDERVCGALYHIVDNNNQNDFKYICFGNRVFTIPIFKDSSKQDGLYIREIDNSYLDKQTSLSRYELSELEQFGIYSTKEKAMAQGKLNDMYKEERLAAETYLTRLKSEIETQEMLLKEAFNKRDHELKMSKMTAEMEINDHKKSNYLLEIETKLAALEKTIKLEQDRKEAEARMDKEIKAQKEEDERQARLRKEIEERKILQQKEEDERRYKIQKELDDRQIKLEREYAEHKARIQREEEERELRLQKERDDRKARLEKEESETRARSQKEEHERLMLNLKEREAVNKKAMEDHLASLEKERTEMKLAADKRTQEMQRYYEERSYDRKDSSEAMKWLTPIATAGATVLAIKVLESSKTSEKIASKGLSNVASSLFKVKPSRFL